jgi:hypothetical protein
MKTYTVVSDGQVVGGRFPDRHSAVNSENFKNATGNRVEVVSPDGQVVAVRIAANIVGYNNEHRMPEERE